MIVCKNAVYSFIYKMCPDYRGSFGDVFEAGNALYLAPQSPKRFAVAWELNGYNSAVSKDMASIIVTLFNLSHMSGI